MQNKKKIRIDFNFTKNQAFDNKNTVLRGNCGIFTQCFFLQKFREIKVFITKSQCKLFSRIFLY